MNVQTALALTCGAFSDKGLFFESEALQKEVGALLWVIRAVEKAAEVRGEAVARGAKAGSSHLAAPTFPAFGW